MAVCWAGFLLGFQPRLFAQPVPKSDVPAIEEALHLLDTGKPAQARAILEEVDREGPHFLDAQIGIARALVEERRWEEALKEIDRAFAKAPEDPFVRYYKAIIHRELAKFDVIYARRHREEAESLLVEIIQNDSTFGIALHELALLKRYAGAYAAAIDLGHRQIKIHPDNPEAHIGLHRTYRHFMTYAPEEEVKKVLENSPEPYALFFQAEMDRHAGRPNFAAARLEKLLGDTTGLPQEPILLARAKLHYAERENRAAQKHVSRAMDELHSEVGVRFLFEEFKYILEDAELYQYLELNTVDEKQAFFKALWTKRDPMPGRLENVRLTEHYQRFLEAEKEYRYYGIRSWHNNPDKAGYLSFPEVTYLNEDFNDKGLVYIRNGDPLDKISHVGGEDNFFRTQILGLETSNWMPSERQYNTGYSLNESWRYRDPDIDFHFVVADNEENNWRLIPLLTSFDMLESREIWGDPYASMVRALRAQAESNQQDLDNFAFSAQLEDGNEEFDTLATPNASVSSYTQRGQAIRYDLEIEETRQRMIVESQKSIELGLATDRHTWEEEVEPMPIPHMVVTFKGEEGKTELDLYYALPIGRISEDWQGQSSRIPVESGYAILDTNWQVIDQQAATKRLPKSTDKTAAIIDYHRAEVLPDSYLVALHGLPEESNLLGGYKFGLNVPDYSSNDLQMSDLLLAHDIKPDLSGDSRFSRNGFKIESNPFQRYSVRQIVYIYFELYNLSYSSDDLTKYEIEYVLTQDEKDKGIKLFRRKTRPILSLKVDRSGQLRSPVEYAEFDVQQVDPGQYTMTIRITDLVADRTVEKSQSFELTP